MQRDKIMPDSNLKILLSDSGHTSKSILIQYYLLKDVTYCQHGLAFKVIQTPPNYFVNMTIKNRGDIFK